MYIEFIAGEECHKDIQQQHLWSCPLEHICFCQVLGDAGQLDLGSSRPESSWPGQISAWSHIRPGGICINEKEFIQQKLEEGCLIQSSQKPRITPVTYIRVTRHSIFQPHRYVGADIT